MLGNRQSSAGADEGILALQAKRDSVQQEVEFLEERRKKAKISKSMKKDTESAIDELVQKRDDLEKTVDGLDNKKKAGANRLAELERKEADLRIKLGNVKKDVEEEVAELASVSEMLAKGRSDMDSLEARKKVLGTEVTEAEKKAGQDAGNAGKELEGVKNSIESGLAEQKEVLSAVRTATNELDGLGLKLAQIKEDVEKSSKELESIRAKVTNEEVARQNKDKKWGKEFQEKKEGAEKSLKTREDDIIRKEAYVSLLEGWIKDKLTQLTVFKNGLEKAWGKKINVKIPEFNQRPE